MPETWMALHSAVCFSHAISGQKSIPTYLSSDNDPLFLFERWKANLRILDVAEIKTVPYVPLSHPFIERLIGTVRREYLVRIMFWTCSDLENKLLDFQNYYNNHRTHSSLEGRPPNQDSSGPQSFADLHSYRWQSHCGGIYQTPIAA
jgi:putative transposase